MSEWCEHIVWFAENNCWNRAVNGLPSIIEGDWKFCPFCGRKRPEKKKLWEMFVKMADEGIVRYLASEDLSDKKETGKRLANTALDAVMEELDQWRESWENSEESWTTGFKKLKDRLNELR